MHASYGWSSSYKIDPIFRGNGQLGRCSEGRSGDGLLDFTDREIEKEDSNHCSKLDRFVLVSSGKETCINHFFDGVFFLLQMTANTVSESAEECYANGMDSFVSKPITLQTLKQCLQTYLV